jgi:hypothetical protein
MEVHMKIFKNIGTLDLRKASSNELKEISSIKNVGTLLLSTGQSEHTSGIKQENIGTVYTLSEDIKVMAHNGAYTLSHDVLDAMDKKILLMINGILKVEDIEGVDLESRIYKIAVNGRVVAKEKDFGMISSILELNGEASTYRSHETYIEGEFSLEDDELYGMKADTCLLVDTLRVTKDFDLELFHKKLKNIRVGHDIVIKKHFIPDVAEVIENYSNVKKTVIKEGYDYYDQLTLEKSNLPSIQERKIHVGGTLKIKISPELLLEKVEKIICKKLEVKKDDLEKIQPLLELVEKIKIIDSEVTTNYSEYRLIKENIKALRPLKLENYGKAYIDEEISETEVLDYVASIENFGLLYCSKEQYGSIMNKMINNYGTVKISNDNQEENLETDSKVVSNMGNYQY